MFTKAKFGVASALILVAIATSPALVCINYLAQNTSTHNCCPQEKPQNAVLARCCAYSPAVTSQSVNVAAPMVVPATFMVLDPPAFTSDFYPVTVLDPDTSPPGCSSVLRI